MQFLNYYKALVYAPRPKSAPIIPFVAVYVLFFIGIYLGGANGWFPFISALAFTAGILLFYSCSSNPNLESSFPVNHRKKLLYRFLASLFIFLIMIVTIIVAMLVVFLISLLVTSILSGGFGWISDPTTGEDFHGFTEAVFTSMGVYGGLFGVAYFIILYSAGMITGFIKKRKTRNIFLICLCIALFVSDFFMGLPYYTINGTFVGVRPFSKVCYEAMALPWLSTIFWFIIAAAMLGTAIYMGIKHYNPKKF